MTLSTHVLDAGLGQPATGVPVSLYHRSGDEWDLLGEGLTDADGRVTELAPDGLQAGVHRLEFDTGTYFAASDQTGFYPEVRVTFEIVDPEQHYHVPLLLSPYAFSTYRGS
ncbi:MAG TPA: hydroxyisourate hydrolase [Jiangellaceae bacterium]|jgi:5-hydroxyisourate hydrolase|nr:hydroxyisourate hydrolase [Jiangellaceae bacterium]